MAHVQKIKRNGVIGLVIHCERREGCELSNKDIDTSRTHLNYNLAKDIQPLKPEVFLKQRINEVKHINRDDIVYMADWIITIPKDVPNEDTERFFDFTFQFLKEKYGSQNVVSAWVHNDESTPHIHFSFIPVITIDGVERLNCKKIITKTALKQFHPELASYLEQRLGYMPSIQNDATINGNRIIKELKNQEDISLQKAKEVIRDNIAVSNEVATQGEQIEYEGSFLTKVKSISQANKVIKDLTISNKKLSIDNNKLIQIINVQKEEIDMYRAMPLAKRLKQKEQVINNLYSSIDNLENQVTEQEYDFTILRRNYDKLEEKKDKLEKELFIHKIFLECFDLTQIYKTFKKNLNKDDWSIDIHTLKDLCHKAYEKLSHVFHTLKDRIHFLDENHTTEEIVLKESKHHYHDMEL